MRNNWCKSAIIFAIVLTCSMVYAGPLGVTFKVSTLGIGGDVTLDLGETLNARAGASFFQYDETVDLDEADIDGTLSLQNFPVTIDWHPWKGGFRVSGGVVINNNEVSMDADPNESIKFNGTDYIIEELSGEVTFPQVAPYVGIGYGNATSDDDGRIHFACDFGVMIQGAPEVDVTATASHPALQSLLDTDLQAEVDEFEDDAAVFSLYPVFSVGFSIAL